MFSSFLDNMCNILFEILKMQQRPDCNNTEDRYSSIKGMSFVENRDLTMRMSEWEK